MIIEQLLVADVTFLQPLPCMDTHVVLELLLLAEDHVADGAGLALLPGVGPLVGVAGALVSSAVYSAVRRSYLVTEHHLTEVAFVRLDPQVDPNMTLQVALLDKLLRAEHSMKN